MRPTAAERSRWRTTLANGIDPQPIRKKIADITDMLAREDVDTDDLLGGRQRRGRAPVPSLGAKETTAQARRLAGLPAGDLADLVQELTTQMMLRQPICSSNSRPGCAMK